MNDNNVYSYNIHIIIFEFELYFYHKIANNKVLFTDKALHQVSSIYSNKSSLSELPVNC